MFRKHTIPLLVFILLFASLAMGCRKGNPIYTPSSSFASPSATAQLADVKKLIMTACVESGWTPMDMGGDVVEARIVVRGKHTVEVTIPYTRNSYKIVYKNSINMEYSAAKGTIHPNYNKWVNTLSANISKRLSLNAIR